MTVIIIIIIIINIIALRAEPQNILSARDLQNHPV